MNNLLRLSFVQTRQGALRPISASLSQWSHRTRYFCTAKPQQEEKEKLFDKILIANRGEIACRVMRTCERLGIKTVAVYSEPDAKSLHVQTADEAYCIGPAASSKSYLNMEKILEVIDKSGAQAVHPGYGFLSENSHFVEALEKRGVTFIGPGTHAMEIMGGKIESKKLAKSAGVHVIPGFLGEVHTDEEVIKISNEIGYPVMIKASAGGGGKGMRIAYNDKEAIEGFRLSKQEAMSSFGDDKMLIEKFIENPRHIEIQVLCDGQGTSLYLNERECSIQRRNQKVIEEAPSPFLTPEVRKSMGEQAIALANAVQYKSAGTVEMLVDEHRNFYFLEMNTRLQVEHPISEMITGVDIVEQMIRIAAGYPLKMQQSDIGIKGWAIESRIYAENPLRNFLPSIGKLTTYEVPTPEENEPEDSIRVDTGVEEGSDISMYYDPMIAKLVTYGRTRNEAIGYMMSALDKYRIEGLDHNINFLRDVMENTRFITGDISTKFIPEEYPNGFHGHVLTEEKRGILGAAAAIINYESMIRSNHITGQLKSRFETLPEDEIVITVDGVNYEALVFPPSEHLNEDDEEEVIDYYTVLLGNEEHRVYYEYTPGQPIFKAVINEERVIIQVTKPLYDGFELQFCGTKFPVKARKVIQAELEDYMPKVETVDHSMFLLSPMPGTLVSVNVKAGDLVTAGQELAVVEAMKMQNILRCEADGKIKEVLATPGQSVQLDQVILEFE